MLYYGVVKIVGNSDFFGLFFSASSWGTGGLKF
jgi:hypothetical protein